MRIIHYNFSDIVGGAARAAYRLHHALLADNIESQMQVVKANSGDWTVSSPTGALFKLGTHFRPQVAAVARKLLKTHTPTPISSAILPSCWPALINKSDADIVHLHWLCAEMMSVEDIGRIRKPVVWTFHDMWAFSGAEHVSDDMRWHTGYTSENRPSNERGLDLNRWVWKRKLSAWRRPMQVVAPSKWLADCVRQSALMRDWPVVTIPNAIDTNTWKPTSRKLARQLLGLPEDGRLIAFGAMGNGHAHHKGFDLLESALTHLRGQVSDLGLIVFGQMRPQNPPEYGHPVHYMGHLHDDISLRLLYCAADAVVIPSRFDNLPNLGVEALACGTPVVAFNACGLPDIVSHQRTGWLANAFDTEDLACGIQWVLADEIRRGELSLAAREYAVANFSYPVVAAQYKSLYEDVLRRQSNY